VEGCDNSCPQRGTAHGQKSDNPLTKRLTSDRQAGAREIPCTWVGKPAKRPDKSASGESCSRERKHNYPGGWKRVSFGWILFYSLIQLGPYYITSSPLAPSPSPHNIAKPRLLSKATGVHQYELSIRRSKCWIDGRMLMTVGSIAIKRSHFLTTHTVEKVPQQLRQRTGAGTQKDLLAASPVNSRPTANKCTSYLVRPQVRRALQTAPSHDYQCATLG